METVKYDGPLSPSSSTTNLFEKCNNTGTDNKNNKQHNNPSSATLSRENSVTTSTTNEQDVAVAQFLEQLKLSKYLSIFEEQEIDMETMLTLSEADLVSIGIRYFDIQ